jgi:hypothetical protein
VPAITNPSGAAWWRHNQSRYPNSRDMAALDPSFRDRVSLFVAALRAGGASVVITSTLRSPIRAYLMHYAWLVANRQIEPSRVPHRDGVVIDWDHGDDKASARGGQEMVDLAHMAHIASLTSNHTRGLAIDMNIIWRGDLFLKVPGTALVRLWKIDSLPRTGSGNRDLHAIAAERFQVRKLASDAPHWSSNGR